MIIKNVKYRINEVATFIDDVDKMRDFKTMTKDDFLAFYSYITAEEYEATKKELEKKGGLLCMKKQLLKNILLKHGRN